MCNPEEELRIKQQYKEIWDEIDRMVDWNVYRQKLAEAGVTVPGYEQMKKLHEADGQSKPTTRR